MASTPYNYALDLLSQRAYTAKSLRQKLVQKEIEPEEADSVIERLRQAGFIDDAKYAASFARTKMLGAGSSARRIKQELARKGVDSETASNAIERVIADEEIDTSVVIERAARKKLATMGDLDPLTLRRRLYGFLARRGYDMDDIQRVVQALLTR